MTIQKSGAWAFETLDYSIYHHIVNQKMIVWFVTNYSFSSDYINSSYRKLDLVSFCGRKLVINEHVVNAILLYVPDAKNFSYSLEIFPDDDRFWKIFMGMFDCYTGPDLRANKALRKMKYIIKAT